MNLILGGTHGLGREIAKALQARGEATFVTGRSYDEAEHGQGMKVDLTKPKDVAALVETIATLDDLSGFFWAAGYGYIGDFADELEPEMLARVNFADVMPIAQAAWQRLLQSGGRFVVISSTSGAKARKDEALYAATKHAQVGFTRSLGLESERLGSDIKVALFMPGGMQTPFWGDERPAGYATFLHPAKVAARIIERTSVQQEPFYEETIERGSL